MKKSFFLAGCFAIALFFAACGDDSSSGNNVDQEMDESSSSVGDSTEVSSSAVYWVANSLTVKPVFTSLF